VIRTCVDCGQAFVAKGSWMRRCWSCWREQKDEEQRSEAWDEGYDAGYAAGQRTSLAPALEGDLLRDAIVLCHPDRHPPDRFELANTVTAKLLELRERSA
jgi:hypothetical protein